MTQNHHRLVAGLVLAITSYSAASGPVVQDDRAAKKELAKDAKIAPFVPTPQDVVEEMLKLANVTKNDVVYDLGSGDGRIVITAAKKYGARGVGIEIDADLVKSSTESARAEGVEKLITIRQGDVMQADVSGATVVTLYLLPNANRLLRPKLQETLKPGSRIVSHNFKMRDWEPTKTRELRSKDDDRIHTIYLWKITGEEKKKGSSAAGSRT